MQTQDLIAELEEFARIYDEDKRPYTAKVIHKAITHIATQDALLGEAAEHITHDIDCERVSSSIRPKMPACSCGADDLLARITAHLRPVDPLVLEARKLVECTVRWSPQTDRDLQSGKNDETREMKIALAAIKRGMELVGIGKEVG